MRLTILGTGSARPVGDSAQSGVLVQSGETSILFDIGSGIAKQVEARVGATNLAALFVGHFHADHWIDIGPMRYRFPWAEDAQPKLPVFLPPGGRDKLDHSQRLNERPGFFSLPSNHRIKTGQRFEVGPHGRAASRRPLRPRVVDGLSGPNGERVVYAATGSLRDDRRPRARRSAVWSLPSRPATMTRGAAPRHARGYRPLRALRVLQGARQYGRSAGSSRTVRALRGTGRARGDRHGHRRRAVPCDHR